MKPEMPKDSGMSTYDMKVLAKEVKSCQNIKGEMAEVGVWRGRSAKVISENKGRKDLHLFDTFEKIPMSKWSESDKPLVADNLEETANLLSSDLNKVKEYLKKEKRLYFHQCIFPDRLEYDGKFSFVNLDTDLEVSTRESLEWFYPKMSVGGKIVIHDYIGGTGVMKAVDEFLDKKREKIKQISMTQGRITKL